MIKNFLITIAFIGIAFLGYYIGKDNDSRHLIVKAPCIIVDRLETPTDQPNFYTVRCDKGK